MFWLEFLDAWTVMTVGRVARQKQQQVRNACLAAVALVAAAAALGAGTGEATPGTAPALRIQVFANTDHHLDSIVWTGKQFLYVANTTNTVYAGPAAGLPLRVFARMPKLVEETRCILSPGSHGFAPGVIFCHSPDNKIYEITPDGGLTTFATLPAPYPPAADGALTFDSVGRFGYRLIAATGRSGNATPAGGVVFAISASAVVQRIGSYGGPGGADEVAIAPARFGSVAGEALLTVDGGKAGGNLVAMNTDGQTRTIARFPGDGINPIVEIPTTAASGTAPAPGLYLTDDENPRLFFVPAAQLAPFAGDLFVATEDTAHFFIIEPDGNTFRALRLPHNPLRGGHYSIEEAIFVG
jgi:hypothetical protein